MTLNTPNFFDLEQFTEKGMTVLKFTKQSLQEKNLNPGFSQIQHGFLINSLDQSPPSNGSSIETVCDQIKRVILPGILNWQASKFFGYFPSTVSDASVYADIFSTSFFSPAFNYAASPAHTELENVVVNWCHQALGLPEKFKNKNLGGGVISSSTSNSVFLAVHAAKKRKLKQLNVDFNHPKSYKLVGYVSQTAHICTLRAFMLKDIQYRRQIPCIFSQQLKNYIVDIQTLNKMIQQDINNGLTPFFCGASTGTTWSGAVDPIQQVAMVCKKYGMWLNVDAAYLGSTWLCPEFRDTMRGVEFADSVMLNFSKMGFTGVGGSLFFVGDKLQFQQAMSLNNKFHIYRESNFQVNIIEYKDWRIDLMKPSTCFKFYFLFKMYGLDKLRQAYRYRQQQSKFVEKLISQSDIFEPFSKRSFSLNCFKLKNDPTSNFTKMLSTKISDIKQGYTTGAQFKGTYVLRIATGNLNTTQQQLLNWFNKVSKIAQSFMNQNINIKRLI